MHVVIVRTIEIVLASLIPNTDSRCIMNQSRCHRNRMSVPLDLCRIDFKFYDSDQTPLMVNLSNIINDSN